MCIHVKIYVIILDSFYVLLLKHFDFFLMFLLLSTMFDIVFHKIFMTKQNKRQTMSSIFPSSENNEPIWKLFKQNKPKEQLSFLGVKILEWFTIIGYTIQNTFLDHTLH